MHEWLLLASEFVLVEYERNWSPSRTSCLLLLLAHLTLLPDPFCECRSSTECVLVWPSLRRGTHQRGEGAARFGGGAAVTVEVMGVVGTDWLISHSHPWGMKDQEAQWVWTVCAIMCVCVTAGTGGRVKDCGKYKILRLLSLDAMTPHRPPFPVSIASAWAGLHFTAPLLLLLSTIMWTHVGLHAADTSSIVMSKYWQRVIVWSCVSCLIRLLCSLMAARLLLNEDHCCNQASCETAGSIQQLWIKSKFGAN